MTKADKQLSRFLRNPTAIKFPQIEKILLRLGFTKEHGKGSHIKFYHSLLPKTELIFPVHNNDCAEIYKKTTARVIKNEDRFIN